MIEIAIPLLMLLFIVAIVAGFVDAAAGGGGLITLPALLLAGVPPLQVLGTNKLQACCGTLAATWHFAGRRMLQFKRLPVMIAAVAVGTALGVAVVQLVGNQFLVLIMPLALIGIALYVFFAKQLGVTTTAARLTDRQFASTAAAGVGFYDGFFGPGTGTFFAIALVKCLGMDLVTATAHAKALNFTSNIVALLLFLVAGHVLLVVGLLMAAGQIIGGRLGAGMVISHGVGYIRLLTTLVCVAMSISLLMSGW